VHFELKHAFVAFYIRKEEKRGEKTKRRRDVG